MGRAYPVVGLHSKYYDLDMDPLCQIVQDTVGRHDSFALACTRKYYEDLGYLGHVNCTENFNAELDPFAIAPRKGWEALNFFYNTGFDSDHVLFLDEPWSRPGDFVLLRRSTTSSARRRPARTTSTRPTAGSAPTCTSASTPRRTASRWPSRIVSPRTPTPS